MKGLREELEGMQVKLTQTQRELEQERVENETALRRLMAETQQDTEKALGLVSVCIHVHVCVCVWLCIYQSVWKMRQC